MKTTHRECSEQTNKINQILVIYMECIILLLSTGINAVIRFITFFIISYNN